MTVPARTCIGCRVVRPSSELTRIGRGPSGWTLAPGGGRGAWVCAGSQSCLEQALGRGRLARALRSEVTHHELDQISRLVLADWMEEPGQEPLG
ncbi:MAG: YlxR family protein [Actinomycetia bacterium]|nr:YlxR family protein [Actinomycetes bacterium]